MPSLKFPDTGTRMAVYGTGRPAAGASSTFYTDVACTVLAEIYQDVAGVKGALIADATVTRDQYGQCPDFWGPAAGTDRLYARTNGVVSVVDADYNARLDATPTMVAADLRYGRYELARGISPAAGVLAALSRGHSTCIQLVSDSTAVLVGDQVSPYTPWPVLFAARVAAAYPAYNVLTRTWNATNQTYDAPVTVQTGSSGASRVTTSGSPALRAAGANVTADLDVRVKIKPNSWASGGLQVFAGKWVSTGNQRSWWFGCTSTGLLCLTWTTGGDAGTQVQKFSTVVNGLTNGITMWVRATLDVDNGAAGSTLTFYTSVDGAAWTQLGAPVVTAGVTSIFASTATYQLSSLDTTFGSTGLGEYYWVEVRDGIGATGYPVVPPLPDMWDQASLSTTGTALIGGSPTFLLVVGGEGGQNLVYWSNATRKKRVLSPHGAHLLITSSVHNETFITNDAWVAVLAAWQAIAASEVPGVPHVYMTQNPAKAPVAQNEIDVRLRRGTVLMAWARGQSVVYALDTVQAFTDTATQVSSDGTHPNVTGAQAWADYVYRALLLAG